MEHLPPSATQLAASILEKIDALSRQEIDLLDFFAWFATAAQWTVLYDDHFTAALCVIDAIYDTYNTGHDNEDVMRHAIINARPLFDTAFQDQYDEL